jgi:hypothetical protein
MLALAALWIAANFYLWSMKQSQLTLFWQSLGMAAIAYLALYAYVTMPVGESVSDPLTEAAGPRKEKAN